MSAPSAQPEDAYHEDQPQSTNQRRNSIPPGREEDHLLSEIISQEEQALNDLIEQASQPETDRPTVEEIPDRLQSEDEIYGSLFMDYVMEHESSLPHRDPARGVLEQSSSQIMDICPP